jgi:hypothetical protein
MSDILSAYQKQGVLLAQASAVNSLAWLDPPIDIGILPAKRPESPLVLPQLRNRL